MPIGYPLSIESIPEVVAANNLGERMPKALWQKIRERAIEICGEGCGICGADDVKLSLHESWEFFWGSGATSTDSSGNVRCASEECLQPYQVLSGVILVCPNCRAVKNLESTRKLAREGKLNIEPILQHYMRVNGVSRQKVLRQWAAHRGQHREIFQELSPAPWKQLVQVYDETGYETDSYCPVADWLRDVTANGVTAIDRHLFLRISKRVNKDTRTPEQIALDEALIEAIKVSDTEDVVSLLEQGASPNCSTEVDLYGFGAQQMSALDLAMSWFCRKDTSRGNAFGYADEEFNEPIVRALIDGGASLSKFSEFDEPPLCRAAVMEVLSSGR